MSEAVRIAEALDLDRLRDLLTLAVSSTAVARATPLYREEERLADPSSRLERALADHRSLLCVATIDGYVVGFTLARQREHSSGLVTHVEELFVEEEAREVGLGEGLLDAAVVWSRSVNSTAIELDALPGDRALKNLCERSGLRSRALIMHRPL